jgi:hypothetical protein
MLKVNIMLRNGDRVIVMNDTLSWNGKMVLVKIGEFGTVIDAQSKIIEDSTIRVLFDGKKKCNWVRPSSLKILT